MPPFRQPLAREHALLQRHRLTGCSVLSFASGHVMPFGTLKFVGVWQTEKSLRSISILTFCLYAKSKLKHQYGARPMTIVMRVNRAPK